MRSQPLNGRLFTKKASLAAVAFAAVSFTVMVPSVRAQFTTGSAQAVIEGFITPATKTINTATAAELASAVAEAITSNTDTSISPAVFAAAAIAPYPFGTPSAKVRGDRNTSAALVAEQAITPLITSTDANFASDVAAITDTLASLQYVVTVHGAPTTVDELSTAGQSTLVKGVLAKLADEVVANDTPINQAGYVAASGSTGAALTADANLEGLPKNALLGIVETGIEGINGAKGKDQTIAPQVAESFAAGLVESGSTPDGVTVPLFAYDILTKVAVNTNVDELVSNAIGIRFPAQLQSVAQELFSKYTSSNDIAKITQGLTAVVASGSNNEDQRVAFVSSLLTGGTAVPLTKVATDAVPVDVGASFVDPYYASNFTQTTFNALTTEGAVKSSHNPNALAEADAAKIATAEGQLLGSDGDELSQVASVFAGLISATGGAVLPASNAGTYAADLINGAVKGLTTTSTFAISGLGAPTPGEGGKLNVGTVTPGVVNDLTAIGDLFADSVISQDNVNTSAGLKKAVSALTTLAEDIAKQTKNQSFSPTGSTDPGYSGPSTVPVGEFLAGTLINYISGVFGADGNTVASALENAIIKGVTAITDSTIDAQVKSVIEQMVNNAPNPNYYTNFPGFGAIATPETPETNL